MHSHPSFLAAIMDALSAHWNHGSCQVPDWSSNRWGKFAQFPCYKQRFDCICLLLAKYVQDFKDASAMCWSPWFTVSSVSAHRISPPNLKTSTPCKCYDASKKFRQQQDETGNLRVGASCRNVRNLLLWAAGLAEMVGPLGERGRTMMQNATGSLKSVWNHVRVMKKSSEIKLVTFAWPSKLHYISLPSHYHLTHVFRLASAWSPGHRAGTQETTRTWRSQRLGECL